jgi:hypothetical protein
MRRLALLSLVGALAFAPAGCGASSKPTGTLTGTLAVYGGLMHLTGSRSCGCEAEPGLVRLLGSRGTGVILKVGKSGKFSAQVHAGRYRVEAGTTGPTHWPMGTCRLLLIADEPGRAPTPHKYLTVRRSQTTHVAVGCVAI